MITHVESLPHEGDIAYVNLNPRVGREQSGHRPCVIVTPADYHAKSSYMIICPITSNVEPYPFKVLLPAGLSVAGAVLVDQVKSIDRQARGCRIVGRLPDKPMADIRGMLASLLGIASS